MYLFHPNLIKNARVIVLIVIKYNQLRDMHNFNMSLNYQGVNEPNNRPRSLSLMTYIYDAFLIIQNSLI